MAEGFDMNGLLGDISVPSCDLKAIGGFGVLSGVGEIGVTVTFPGDCEEVLSGATTNCQGANHQDQAGLAKTYPDIAHQEAYKGWNTSHVEARCDFTFKPRITRRSDLWFVSVWQKSLVGRTLTDIKSDDAMIHVFAEEVGQLIEEVLGSHLKEGGYALVTSPKRRHKEHNFATLIAAEMAERLGIPFYEDAAQCRTRKRMHAVFDAGNIPEERNVIVFDDFVTTGQTMRSMADLLLKYSKNLTFFCGINNKL